MSASPIAHPLPSPEKFLARVRAEFPADFFVTDDADRLAYGRDWTKSFAPDPIGVAFPRSTEEVARFLKLCDELRYPVVPSGGRTGLAGGAVAARKEAVLSLARLNTIGDVDVLARTVRVGAGAVTEAVHEAAKIYGLTWPVDFASKGSSTVGGNIATNAGGVNVIRYGLTRNWVLGLTVVLATGERLELNGALEKNNTGIDLRQLFIGSEGILGVVTEATLRLSPLPKEREIFLFSMDRLETVLEVFRVARQSPFTLNAFEFFTDKCLRRVTQHLGLRTPFRSEGSHTVLIDLEKPDGDGIADAQLDAWLEAILSIEGVSDGVMSQTSEDVKNFWMLREGISESLSATGLPHKNDVSLPIAGLRGFCSELETFFRAHYPDWEICNFGHIGDGNLHINILKPDSLTVEEFRARTHAVDRDLFTLVRKYGGSISAEHGIGLLKKAFLEFTRTPSEVATFRALKAHFDPHGILNPGKVFDATT